MFHPKIRKKTGCLFSPYLFNTVLEALASTIWQENEIKRIQIGKKEVKLSLFADMIVYIENPKEFKENPKTLINYLSNVSRYEVNIQKSIVFLYISNVHSEN